MPQSKEKRVAEFVQKKFGAPAAPARMRGDASTRSFYRIPFKKGTAVMMLRDRLEPEEDRVFMEVRDHLSTCGVAVPEIYEYDEATGVILMEDLGDFTLEERLRGAGEEDVSRLYRQAIEQLLRIQVLGTALPRDCIAFHRAFDEIKLMEELDFFLAHTVEGFYRARIGPGERAAIREGFAALAALIAALPRVINHRDYHSRNLMVMDGTLRVVDFQDARMGACQYDLSSLLRDSYTVLESGFRARMIDCYLQGSGEMGVAWHDREEFMQRFDLVSLQRNLKACGTFGYMAVARGKRSYLGCLDPTFAYVKENAQKFGFMKECTKLLARHVPSMG
jgi:aminoglycoside/choline kinase family phosphotransferase